VIKDFINKVLRIIRRLLEILKSWENTAIYLPPDEIETSKKGAPKGGRYRMVRTSRGGINMPKRQPCPVCSSNSKRTGKTLGGANYRCSKHGFFFVRVGY